MNAGSPFPDNAPHRPASAESRRKTPTAAVYEAPPPLLASRPRLLRALSGLAWAAAFLGGCFVLAMLASWAAAALVEDRLLSASLPWFIAALTLSAVMPVPAGMDRWRALGLAPLLGAVRRFAEGFGLTAALAAAVVGVQVAAGWAAIETAAPAAVWWAALPAPLALLSALATFLIAAAGEELLLRGYFLQQLGRALQPPGAIVASAALFGLLHASNPGASPLAVANTFLFGVFFGLALLRRRTWWTPYGLHAGWNFTLAVLGAPISGLTIKVTAWSVVAADDTLWSGGSYGPEASIPAGLAAAAGIVWLLLRPGAEGPRLMWDAASAAQGDHR